MKAGSTFLAILAAMFLVPGCHQMDAGAQGDAGPLSAASVVDGYRLERLAGNMSRPRMISQDQAGNLLIGSRAGRVYKVAPPYARAIILLETSDYPHSVAVRGDTLFVATTGALYSAPYTPDTERIEPDELTLVAPLPRGGGHSSRTVRAGPDGGIYVSVGISGNCPDEYLDDGYPFNRRRGGVMRLEETSDPPVFETVGSGLRNPIGFDWHPRTGELYAANHGPDHLGFENPREVFVHVTRGSFHGMPWFQVVDGALIRDTCIGSDPPRPAGDVPAPAATFPARNGPMGVAFVPTGFPDPSVAGNAVVALHGSWATLPDGGHGGDHATRRPPALVMVEFDGGQPGAVTELVTGFQDRDGGRRARPAGVFADVDGSIFFTSDSGDQALYRLVRTSP